MNSVCILLSTYNGEKYINDQIISICKQNGCKIKIIIRDDCSTDNTINILKKWNKSSFITVYFGRRNIGYKKSFINLLEIADIECNYFAFSDQDDIWLPDKLISACHILSKINTPAAYCACPQYVDANLVNLSGYGSYMDDLPTGFIRAEWALAYGLSGLGCTTVWNKQLMQILKSVDYSRFNFGHDNLISVLAPLVGKLYRDDKKVILYRQHGNNVGSLKKKEKNIIRKINRSLFSAKRQEAFQLRKFIAGNFSEFIPNENIILLRQSIEYKNNLLNTFKFLFSNFARGINKKKYLKFLLKILLRLY